MVADFTRMRPAGYAANTTLTSVELTQTDAYWPSVLRRDGIGHVTGNITWNTSSSWTMADGSNGAMIGGADILLSDNATIHLEDSAVIDCSGTTGVIVSGGAVFLVGSGGFLTMQSGAAGQMQSGSTLAVQNGAAVTFSTGSTCTFNNGTYPLLDAGHAGRTQTRRYHFSAGTVAGTGWSTYAANGNGALGPGTAAAGYLALPALMNGAVLTTLKIYFTPIGGHAGLPAVNIAAALQFRTPTVGATSTLFTSGASSTYSPVSLADYNNGLVKSLTIACGTPTIDVGTNIYILTLTDENGANALSGNVFHCVEAVYTITDLSPR